MSIKKSEVLRLFKEEKKDGDILLISGIVLNKIYKFYFTKSDNIQTFDIPSLYSSFDKNRKWFYFVILCFLGVIKPQQVCITIICANATNTLFLYCLKKIFPKAKIINRFVDEFDEVNHFKDPLKLISYCNRNNIKIETYSYQCAKNFNIEYVPNYVNKAIIDDYLANSNIVDRCFFAGSCSNVRANLLLKIAEVLLENQINVLFYLNELKADAIDRAKRINKKYNGEFIIYNKFIDYEIYIRKLLESSVIIDLYRVRADEGYSFRVAEALSASKKLITNRILDFSSDSIFFLESNIKIDNLVRFIKVESINKNELNNTFSYITLRDIYGN